jgi:hypothetical protein
MIFFPFDQQTRLTKLLSMNGVEETTCTFETWVRAVFSKIKKCYLRV